MSTRRRALALLSGALAATSGCVSGLLDDDPPLEHGERMRATGEPASRTLTGWPPDTRYVPSNDTVYFDHGDPDDPHYWDAERWATEQGERAAQAVVVDRFDPSVVDYDAVRVYHSGERTDTHVDVRHVTYSEHFGNETVTPARSITELVETAPETVHVTVPLDEQRWTISYPVFVERYDYIEHTASE
ncbi:hypothetical protein [Halorubellus sp. PRR65]|uniref:hypothetical protein n=1 Tax=Halorubellus sp. PRR65 TaxID=3098148 RepID=UPI002B2613C6|nr:hypothetical protein [Halorubellus sp. PRR65]